MKRRTGAFQEWRRSGSWVVVWAILWAAGGCAPEPWRSDLPPRLIAHAGGIGNQRTDTNSLEALNASVSRGHTVIEVDFSWTTDGHLVLLHDWDRTLTSLFGRKPGAMAMPEFRSLASLHGLIHLDLDDLVVWLERNPDVLIVTDIKTKNTDGLRLIAERHSEFRNRFVPQVFTRESIDEVRRLGYDRVIFSLYRTGLSDSQIFEIVLEKKPWAVTMPARRAEGGKLSKDLSRFGVTVFAHTVNDHPTAARLREAGVYGVYTDWLSPFDRDHSGPLPEWSEETSGEVLLGRRIFPFFSWGMDGMDTQVELRSMTGNAADVRVDVRSPNGELLMSKTARVSDSGRLLLDLASLAPVDGDHGWIEMETSSEIDARASWSFRNQSRGKRVLSENAVVRFETSGPGSELGGMLVAIVNPTDVAQTYRLVRSISSEVIDDETVEVRSGAQLVRVYRSWTEGTILVSLSGGPMVVQALRWDPMGRFLK